MKLLQIICASIVMATIGTSAYAKDFGLLKISHVEMTPVTTLEQSTPIPISTSKRFYEFYLRPTKFVKTTAPIKKLNVESDSSKRRQVDYHVPAGTSYHYVGSNKSDFKIYCTKKRTGLSRHKKKDKPFEAGTCLVDTDHDGAFDKIHLSTGVTGLSIHSIAPFLGSFGADIAPVSYTAAQVDTSIVLKVVIGYQPDMKQFPVFPFQNKIKVSEMKLDDSRLSLFLLSEDPDYNRPFIVKGSSNRVKKISPKPATFNFELLKAEITRTDEGIITFGIQDGPKMGDTLLILQSVL